MLNNKLKAITKYIEKQDNVIDIGCDHAYLAIYLSINNLCNNVYAADISPSVIKIAKENIKKSKCNIIVYLADGFKNINNPNIDTAVISGMGTNTIMNIIKNAPLNIKKYIISSNNNHYELRKFMYEHKYYLVSENVIFDHDKYYPIMLFTRKYHKLSNKDLKYGISNNKNYFTYLLNKEQNINRLIPNKHFITKLKHYFKIKELTKIIKRMLD